MPRRYVIPQAGFTSILSRMVPHSSTSRIILATRKSAFTTCPRHYISQVVLASSPRLMTCQTRPKKLCSTFDVYSRPPVVSRYNTTHLSPYRDACTTVLHVVNQELNFPHSCMSTHIPPRKIEIWKKGIFSFFSSKSYLIRTVHGNEKQIRGFRRFLCP